MKEIIHKILYKYIDWERMWFDNKRTFKEGETVKLNWKARVYFRDTLYEKRSKPMKVEHVIENEAVWTDNGVWHPYWLTKKED